MSEKRVYILGAGFSYPAKIPIQSKLLKSIFEYVPSGFQDADFESAQREIDKFLNAHYGSNDGALLEDVFTICDHSVLHKEQFKGRNWQFLCETREQLLFLIMFIINKKMSEMQAETKRLYRQFAKHIIETRHDAGQTSDTIAIISLNWDTLLERFIEEQLTNSGRADTLIDYCTYTHSLDGSGIPHSNIKAKGLYNIKILKLHGSLNWLYCSNCGRLFVHKVQNIGIEKVSCPNCDRIYPNSGLMLESLIITPTFLKELGNLHVKHIWGNALIDLQEATEVVFIGYSIPFADFELKHLLKKAISEDASIHVMTRRKASVQSAYESFFGRGRVLFYEGGWQNWVKAL